MAETSLVQRNAVQAKRQTRARSKMPSLVNSLRLITCPTEAHNGLLWEQARVQGV